MKKLMIKKWYNKMNVGYFEVADVPMDIDGVSMIKNVTEKAVGFYHNNGYKTTTIWIPKSALFIANFEYATKIKNAFEVNYNKEEIDYKNNKANNVEVLTEVEDYLKTAYRFSEKDVEEDLKELKRLYC